MNDDEMFVVDIGLLSGRQTFNDFVGTSDRQDFYFFRLDETSNFSLQLSGLDDDAQVELLADLDGSGRDIDEHGIDIDEVLRSDISSSNRDRDINVTIGSGDYFIHVYTDDALDNTNYILNVEATATPPTTEFDPGPPSDISLDLGNLSSRQTFREFVGTSDRDDFYFFRIDQISDFSLQLSGMDDDAQVQLLAVISMKFCAGI